MKKLAAMVVGGLLLGAGVGVATAGSRCEPFQGTLKLAFNPSPTLGDCQGFDAIKGKERFFEGAVFHYQQLPPGYPLAAPLPLQMCFSGEISGATLGGRAVEATSVSALTVNSFPLAGATSCGSVPCPQMLTAATVVTVTATGEPRKDKELGQIFLRDTGVLLPATDQRGPLAIEQLIGVGGTKKFSNASVSMEIVGYEFAGAPVKGTICR
ncbi:MAG: hypothetical protein ABTR92_13845 [Candidatus Accumulibacter phosphatis]|jgi:hypothetical protein|nr:hypothetical protein [Candidatus Accumulibacter sp. ACC012]